MKEAVKKVIDTLTQEDFHGAFQKLLERYTKCIAAGGDFKRLNFKSIGKKQFKLLCLYLNTFPFPMKCISISVKKFELFLLML